jgi:hypothetical protein
MSNFSLPMSHISFELMRLEINFEFHPTMATLPRLVEKSEFILAQI